MQVSRIRPLFTFIASLSLLTAAAGVKENFNSRKGILIHDLRSNLQGSCWTFHHFDINNAGWNPRIEGDGAMVSTPGQLNGSMYTPLLSVESDIAVSFDYSFNKNFDKNVSRSLRICLVNADNHVVKELETVRFIGINATRSNTFTTMYKEIVPGEYRLLLMYVAEGGDAVIAIDELNTSAAFKYEGGCNIAPIAQADHISGSVNRTASGTVLSNDKEKNGQGLTAYLIKNSPDGHVDLKEDGTFTFTANKDFSGLSTSFVYKTCDEANLCSANTTAVINFPPSGLTDFKGSYKRDGNVEITWNTFAGTDIEKFELQRSLDGRSWVTSGVVSATKETVKNTDYTYIDKIGKNTALKKDLYYRLKQTGIDGSVATSRLLVVRVYNTKAVSMISVTPNPAKSDIAVNLQLHESAIVSMRIINSSGSTMLHKSAKADSGISNVLLEGSSKLNPGVYTLEVIVNSKERMIVKLIKE